MAIIILKDKIIVNSKKYSKLYKLVPGQQKP